MKPETVKLINIAIDRVEHSGGVVIINQEFKIYVDEGMIMIDQINS